MAFKMKAGKEGPMRKNFGKDITPMNFNASLRAASKAGKLDNNPKFKAAVDKAPVKMKKDPMKLKKKSAADGLPEISHGPDRPAPKKGERINVKGLPTPTKMKKKSPKKFIGKAIKGVKKFAQKNPRAATAIGGLVGGPIGMLAARGLSKAKLQKGKDRSNQKIA
jgi:hypothetical protein